MKIAKEFRWEMGHRLPEHFGKCKNIHGHSYLMIVEIEGEVLSSGMVMDYYDLKKIINPLVEEVDHSFMVYSGDEMIISFLKEMKSKMVIVNFQSTVENICNYFVDKIKHAGLPQNVISLKVRIYETHDDYAEVKVNL